MANQKALIAAIAGFITGLDILIMTTPLMAAPKPTIQISQETRQPLPPASSNVKRPTQRMEFGLADGTTVKLKFKQAVSSKTAQKNDPVEFEVMEDVRIGGRVVIVKGATARGIVNDVQRSGMLGRRGKLDIAVKEVDLASGERIALRANQESGGGTSGSVIAVSAIINPLFLLLKGKSVTYDAGTEVTAFVDGNYELDRTKFGSSYR